MARIHRRTIQRELQAEPHFSCHLVGGEKRPALQSAGCPWFSPASFIHGLQCGALLGFVLLMEGYSSLPYVFWFVSFIGLIPTFFTVPEFLAQGGLHFLSYNSVMKVKTIFSITFRDWGWQGKAVACASSIILNQKLTEDIKNKVPLISESSYARVQLCPTLCDPMDCSHMWPYGL